jgi:ABC-2 type transport system ATP-binding protein
VEATCDRILIINRGKIVADGTAENLRKQAQGQELITVQIEAPENAELKKSLLGLPTVQTVEAINGQPNYFQVQSKPEVSSKKEVFDLCVQNKWYLTELTTKETRLEDVFREVTN